MIEEVLVQIIGYTTAALTISLGFYILASNSRQILNRSFGLFSIFFGFWALTLVLYAQPLIFTSNFWIRMTYISTFPGIIVLLTIVRFFPGLDKFARWDKLVQRFAIVAAFPFLYALFFTNGFVSEVYVEAGQVVTHQGWVYMIYIVYATLITAYANFRYVYRWKHIKGIAKTQYGYFFLSMVLFGILGFGFDIIIPLIFNTTEYFALSPIAILPSTILMTYSIARYRLMDLRLAIKYLISRVLLFIIIVTPLLTVLYWKGGDSLQVVSIWIAVIVALGIIEGHLTKVGLGSVLEMLLYHRERSKDEVTNLFVKELSSLVELPAIIKLITKNCSQLFDAKSVRVLTRKELVNFIPNIIDEDDTLSYTELKGSLYDDKVDHKVKGRYKKITESMMKFQFDVVVMVKPKQALSEECYLVLGEKSDSTAYSREDFALIERLRYQIRVALEKAQLFEQLREDKQLISAEKNKLAMALEGVTDGVVALDHNKQIIVWNPAFERIVGLSGKRVMNKPVDSVLTFRTRQGVKVDSSEYCRGPISDKNDEIVYEHNELQVLRSDKRSKGVTLQVSTIKEAHVSDVAYILVLHDQTEEQELAKMKLDFVAMAAHELRTPLTSVRGYVSVLSKEIEDKLNDDEKKLVNRIEISSKQLATLVDNLLVVSQIEEGQYNLSLHTTNWTNFVSDQVEQHRHQAEDKEIELICQIPSGEFPKVKVDQVRMGEVMSNLLNNAIQYTQDGSITVSVSYNPKSSEIVTSVTDTGAGIPPEAQGHMFEKFFRVGGSLEQGSKGTGLGLYIAKSIVDIHGGRIWLESEGIDHGSTFSFSLPTDPS